MIYVVTKTKIGKRQISRWNKSRPAGTPVITLLSKRENIQKAISKFASTLPGINYEVHVPVVFVDSFAMDIEEREEYTEEEIQIFNYESDTLTRFLAQN